MPAMPPVTVAMATTNAAQASANAWIIPTARAEDSIEYVRTHRPWQST